MKKNNLSKTSLIQADKELSELINNAKTQLSNRSKRSMSESDLKNAKFEIIEMEITKILCKHQIVISSVHGNLIVPVYLDENFEWFFTKDTLAPWADTHPEKECFKLIKNDDPKVDDKVIICYPLEGFFQEFLVYAITLLSSDFKITFPKGMENKTKYSVLTFSDLISRINQQ